MTHAGPNHSALLTGGSHSTLSNSQAGDDDDDDDGLYLIWLRVVLRCKTTRGVILTLAQVPSRAVSGYSKRKRKPYRGGGGHVSLYQGVAVRIENRRSTRASGGVMACPNL